MFRYSDAKNIIILKICDISAPYNKLAAKINLLKKKWS